MSDNSIMTIGRPTEFDRQEALEKAMDLFWRNGYEATGLTDLTTEMGIGRQSLYNAFGDKHSLFVEAMKHYASQNSQPLIDMLRAPGSGVENIRQTLEAVVSFMTKGECRGCLLTNSIVELAPHDEEVAEIVRSALNRLEKEFKDAVDRAVESGEISADTDTRAMARFLNNTLHGMVVMGKASASKAALKDVVKIALSKME
ncbi:TetR/AcrR family transcriptional regulator [uncultured Gimesia sp.]|uniref:TetR/AcrR family transcriptional regulator n=1 Tax=uncultured Gimesia sp. TaxID=1678688 RepID=UPI0026106508|nr:TetR/AcrR family transcriptional regulator [uncultured Gimesia sp.]